MRGPVRRASRTCPAVQLAAISTTTACPTSWTRTRPTLASRVPPVSRTARPAPAMGFPTVESWHTDPAGSSDTIHRLDQRQDVALGILEPGRLAAVGVRGDAVLGLQVRHVVFLEGHAALAQVGDLGLDVVDLPVGLARLVGAGEAGGVEGETGARATL